MSTPPGGFSNRLSPRDLLIKLELGYRLCQPISATVRSSRPQQRTARRSTFGESSAHPDGANLQNCFAFVDDGNDLHRTATFRAKFRV